MRLGTLNRLKLIAATSAVVTSLLTNSGCKTTKPAPAPAKPMLAPVDQPIPLPATTPTTQLMTLPTTQAATQSMEPPATVQTTMPTTDAVGPTTMAANQPVTLPSTEPATMPAVAPATLPATEPVAMVPAPPVTPMVPATEPAAVPVVPPPVAPAVEPATAPAVAAVPTPAAEPATPPAVVPAPAPAMEPTATPAMPPAQTPAAEPATPAVPPAPAPAVEPATAPAVAPAPTPAVEPATMPAVAPPPTLPVAPATMPATEPATMPATMPMTIPAPAPTSAPTVAIPKQPPAPPIVNAPAPTEPKSILADAALAEQIAGVAELEFNHKVDRKDAWYWIWRHQAALLGAASTLSPAESRFDRLQADALAQIHDNKGELAALLKALTVKPDDEVSWKRRLDLYISDMQTADGKLKYLSAVMGNINVPASVRAHAGFMRVQILIDRGQTDAAKLTLAESLKDCPTNLDLLRLRYSMLPDNAPTYERCGQLMDLLRANPLQAVYSQELADLVADSGLIQESLPWYELAVSTAHIGGNAARESMLNWAAALFVSDQKAEAFRLNSALLQIDPAYTPAHFLQVVITRSLEDKDAFSKAMHQASNALGNRVIEVCNQFAPAGTPKATTRPLDEPSTLEIPDLSIVTTELNKNGTPQTKQQFAEAVTDLAMLEGYFARQFEGSNKLIDAVAAVVPENSPELARLRGWNDVQASKPEEAKAKFFTAAAVDPLAELGLVEIMMSDPAERPKAESMGRRLLQDHPSGLLGAVLWEKLHNERVKLVTTTQADALREQLTQFPTELLSMTDKPQDVYGIHVQPLLVGTYYGEPLLVQVGIQNLSSSDLTIGPDGVIKPELIFAINPEMQKVPKFSAFDNLAGPLVLKAHTRVDQIVRVDQTQLLNFLNSVPDQAFEINGVMVTNQTVGKLGGYPVQFIKTFYRQASRLNPANEQAAVNNLTSGRPEQKITALNLLGLFVRELRAMKTPAEHTPQEIATLIGDIHHARFDTLPAVAAWAGKCEFELVNQHEQSLIVGDMSQSDDWRQRQMSLLLVNSVDRQTRDEAMKRLLIDPQESVRTEAQAIQGYLALLESGTPTTAP